MHNFINAILDEKFKSLNFSEFTKKICGKKLLHDCQEYLIEIFGENPIVKPQILISSLLIKYHHQVVLSSDKNILEQEVYDTANRLVNILPNKSGDKDMIKTEILKWDKLFNHWKDMDKKDLLNQMSKYYREVINMGGENEDIKKKMRSIASKIDCQGGVTKLENGSKHGLLNVDILKNQIKFNMKRAYWDIFEKELSYNPPKFNMYISLVKEIKIDLLSILPKKNIESTSYIINKKLDSNFIENKMRSQTYNLQDIYDLIYFVLDTIKNLDNAESQKRINDKMSELEDKMNQKEKIFIILPNMFSFICDEITCLKTWCEIYKKKL